jgi:hypothetical protein
MTHSLLWCAKYRSLPCPGPIASSFFLAVIGAIGLGPAAFEPAGRKARSIRRPADRSLKRGTVRTPVTRRGAEAAPVKPTEYDENGRPIAPVGTRKKLPADWLID